MVSDDSKAEGTREWRPYAIAFGATAGLITVCLVPIYFVLFPQMTDLQQHILVSKLLWEKLAGISRLDLEISGYLGYRLSSYLIAALIGFLHTFGISLVYLPKLVAATLFTLHAAVVGWVFFRSDRQLTFGAVLLRTGLALPSAVAMYSVCWFMGFVGYTLAISILMLAVIGTEAFLASGRRRDLIILFILLALVYMSHPFALTFWLLWCLSRGLASIVTWAIATEWKRFPFLPLAFAPVAIYDYLMRASQGPTANPVPNFRSFLVDSAVWHTNRYNEVLNGMYFQADKAADGTWMAYFFLAFMLVAALVAIGARAERRIWALSLASVVFLVISSLINEKFFPVPQGHWLAYNYRFVSTTAVVCLAVAGVVILRCVEASPRRVLTWAGAIAGAVAVVVSGAHLNNVRAAYKRFDIPAREYIQQHLAFERPVDIVLPRSDWYPDAKFLRRYTCLAIPDCNPAGTLFRNLGGDIYPVRLRSMRREWPEDMRTDVNALKGGEGYLPGQYSRPRGIAVNGQGGFVVADTGNQRVQIFDVAGGFVSAIHGVENTPLVGPKAVSFGPSSEIYILDGSDLLRFGANRSFEKRWAGTETGLAEPSDLAVDGLGNVFIVDQTRGTVTRFQSKTERFTKINISTGKELSRPTGIAVAGGLLYIADSGNNRILVLDTNGRFVREWEVSAWAKYGFHWPDVAIDPARGRAYVSSGWTRELFAFDTKGRLLEKLTLPKGTESNNPCALAISASGDLLYVLGSGSDKVDNGDPGVVAIPVVEVRPTPN